MFIFNHITLLENLSLKFNSMWLLTKPNIVSSMELTHRVNLKVYAHIFFTILSNLNWCGFQRNRNKYGTLVLASIHSMLISCWDLRPIDVVIITTSTAVVNYILWTNARFDRNMRVLFFTSFWLLKRWYVLVLIITISVSRLIEFWCQLM